MVYRTTGMLLVLVFTVCAACVDASSGYSFGEHDYQIEAAKTSYAITATGIAAAGDNLCVILHNGGETQAAVVSVLNACPIRDLDRPAECVAGLPVIVNPEKPLSRMTQYQDLAIFTKPIALSNNCNAEYVLIDIISTDLSPSSVQAIENVELNVEAFDVDDIWLPDNTGVVGEF